MKSKKNRGENVLRVIVHERMGTAFEISGKIDHSGTILYRVPNVWEWPYELRVSFCENLSVGDILKVRRRVQTRGMFGNLLNTLETPLP